MAHLRLEGRCATLSMVGSTGEGREGKKLEGVMAGPMCYWQKCRKCSCTSLRWPRVWPSVSAMAMALEEARAELVQELASKEVAREEGERGRDEGRRAP